MGLLDPPLATYGKSDLRKPEVFEAAQHGVVEIRGGAQVSVLLVPESAVQTARELRDAIEVFLRAVVELRRQDPSPVVLGRVGFVASWPPNERESFLDGYAEALSTALRIEDAAVIDAYLDVMSVSGQAPERPDISGRVTEATKRELASRLSS